MMTVKKDDDYNEDNNKDNIMMKDNDYDKDHGSDSNIL